MLCPFLKSELNACLGFWQNKKNKKFKRATASAETKAFVWCHLGGFWTSFEWAIGQSRFYYSVFSCTKLFTRRFLPQRFTTKIITSCFLFQRLCWVIYMGFDPQRLGNNMIPQRFAQKKSFWERKQSIKTANLRNFNWNISTVFCVFLKSCQFGFKLDCKITIISVERTKYKTCTILKNSERTSC